ncbi:MAG: sugar phosphate isomerase/epimerase [Treponema sp.]|jgi:D-psicose/D-tagatose/L-ribulose 3-epimerase|nr:sugar phosphate isomerase/epimerase [Treponema sp.]
MAKRLFSINSWIFGGATIGEIAKRAKEIGVDGIDISGEPDTTNVNEVKDALAKYGLVPFCINGNFSDEKRVCCHGDPAFRETAVDYGKKCIDMAAALDCKKVLIVPSRVMGSTFYVSRQADWQHSVESLKKIAEYAKPKNIIIMIECVNAYEVTLVRTLRDGIKMAKETGCDNVKIIADTFHMQLEEQLGIPHAIRDAGSDWLQHVHMGDNTREVPGRGCMNWRDFLLALNEINYTSAVSFEPLPRKMTQAQLFAGELPIEELTAELKQSFDYLQNIQKTI